MLRGMDWSPRSKTYGAERELSRVETGTLPPDEFPDPPQS